MNSKNEDKKNVRGFEDTLSTVETIFTAFLTLFKMTNMKSLTLIMIIMLVTRFNNVSGMFSRETFGPGGDITQTNIDERLRKLMEVKSLLGAMKRVAKYRHYESYSTERRLHKLEADLDQTFATDTASIGYDIKLRQAQQRLATKHLLDTLGDRLGFDLVEKTKGVVRNLLDQYLQNSITQLQLGDPFEGHKDYEPFSLAYTQDKFKIFQSELNKILPYTDEFE